MISKAPLTLTAVSRSFGSTEGFRDLTLEIAPREFVAVVGPSGCGKTTLLNLISGFDQPDTGEMSRSGKLRMIYQQGGLFPWRTAAQNIEMGLLDVQDSMERKRLLDEMLELIGLQGFADHYPHELSGGMRQRVELGRALIGETDILLMDEPFSALDYLTRLRMRRELALMLEQKPCTVVLVTHDIEEAAQLADRVVVLSDRPARIRYELCLDVPRPRDLTHPKVVAATHRILAELGLEADGQPAASLDEIAGSGLRLIMQ